MKIIKLTRSTNYKPIWLNVKNIVCFYGVNSVNDTGTKVELINGAIHTIKEDPSEVASHIEAEITRKN